MVSLVTLSPCALVPAPLGRCKLPTRLGDTRCTMHSVRPSMVLQRPPSISAPANKTRPWPIQHVYRASSMYIHTVKWTHAYKVLSSVHTGVYCKRDPCKAVRGPWGSYRQEAFTISQLPRPVPPAEMCDLAHALGAQFNIAGIALCLSGIWVSHCLRCYGLAWSSY